ncbi:MAG: hypothetical protein J2P55_11070 [Rhizobiales bacterium]|nr:hypothetical protein [Hyphomicrobiales bacterium]
MTKIVTIAHVPEGLEHEWLQYLRDFDIAHPGCHFEVLTDSPLTTAEIKEQLQKIAPGFGHITTIK